MAAHVYVAICALHILPALVTNSFFNEVPPGDRHFLFSDIVGFQLRMVQHSDLLFCIPAKSQKYTAFQCQFYIHNSIEYSVCEGSHFEWSADVTFKCSLTISSSCAVLGKPDMAFFFEFLDFPWWKKLIIRDDLHNYFEFVYFRQSQDVTRLAVTPRLLWA